MLFGLYGAALLGVTAFALVGLSIWRVGAVLFPVGSIGAYVFFALQVHQADYIGLAVKLVELGAITAAVASLAMRRKQDRTRPVAA